MSNAKKSFLKAQSNLKYELTKWEKLLFRFLGRKIISTDYEGDVGCKITAYGYRGHIAIFDVEYFNVKTSPTA